MSLILRKKNNECPVLVLWVSDSQIIEQGETKRIRSVLYRYFHQGICNILLYSSFFFFFFLGGGGGGSLKPEGIAFLTLCLIQYILVHSKFNLHLYEFILILFGLLILSYNFLIIHPFLKIYLWSNVFLWAHRDLNLFLWYALYKNGLLLLFIV